MTLWRVMKKEHGKIVVVEAHLTLDVARDVRDKQPQGAWIEPDRG